MSVKSAWDSLGPLGKPISIMVLIGSLFAAFPSIDKGWSTLKDWDKEHATKVFLHDVYRCRDDVEGRFLWRPKDEMPKHILCELR